MRRDALLFADLNSLSARLIEAHEAPPFAVSRKTRNPTVTADRRNGQGARFNISVYVIDGDRSPVVGDAVAGQKCRRCLAVGHRVEFNQLKPDDAEPRRLSSNERLGVVGASGDEYEPPASIDEAAQALHRPCEQRAAERQDGILGNIVSRLAEASPLARHRDNDIWALGAHESSPIKWRMSS